MHKHTVVHYGIIALMVVLSMSLIQGGALTGYAVASPASCGDGVCGINENARTCPADCSNSCKSIPACATPPSGCSYAQVRDTKGCVIGCGNLLCKPVCGDGVCAADEINACADDCPSVSKCADSDGGLAPQIPGTVRGVRCQVKEGVKTCVEYTQHDACGSGKLSEYYCREGQSRKLTYACDGACVDGACKVSGGCANILGKTVCLP